MPKLWDLGRYGMGGSRPSISAADRARSNWPCPLGNSQARVRARHHPVRPAAEYLIVAPAAAARAAHPPAVEVPVVDVAAARRVLRGRPERADQQLQDGSLRAQALGHVDEVEPDVPVRRSGKRGFSAFPEVAESFG